MTVQYHFTVVVTGTYMRSHRRYMIPVFNRFFSVDVLLYCFMGCDMCIIHVLVYVILKASAILMLGFTIFDSGDKIYSIRVHFEAYIDLCTMPIASIVDDENIHV